MANAKSLEQRRKAVDDFIKAVHQLRENANNDNSWTPFSERSNELKELAQELLLGAWEDVSEAELVKYKVGLLGTDKSLQLYKDRANYYSPDELRVH